MQHSALLNVMIAAARKAARALKRDFGEVEKLQVSLKGPANFVTAADRRAEETCATNLPRRGPAMAFSARKAAATHGTDKTHSWIVDPLDGTTNFLHGIPHFAISIALEREGTIVAGLIYNPVNDELFIAERGKGAFLNDQRLRVAARKRLADAVVACGLPHLGRGDLDSGCANSAPSRTRSRGCAASAPPRSISPGSPPAGSTAIGSATFRRGTWRPASCWCARPAASSPISTAARHFRQGADRRRQRDHAPRTADAAQGGRQGADRRERVSPRAADCFDAHKR